jgi:hypothetical protein
MSGDQGAISAFDAMREALDRAASIDEVRLCEAKAAAIYWNTWSTVPIRLRGPRSDSRSGKVDALRYARFCVDQRTSRRDQSGKRAAQLRVWSRRRASHYSHRGSIQR